MAARIIARFPSLGTAVVPVEKHTSLKKECRYLFARFGDTVYGFRYIVEQEHGHAKAAILFNCIMRVAETG